MTENTPCQDPRAPNLFIIGASKCGTSALHHYLRFHPDICMSTTKEPCFFVDQDHLREAWPIISRDPVSHDLETYLAMFETGAGKAYRGEASVYYSQSPYRPDCAGPIHAFAPEARIIYVVKDPVSRTVGHYWQRAKEFQEPLPLERAVRENPIYRDTSDYALQLSAYLRYFDRTQIKVIDAADLKARRRETLSDLCRWLGVDDHRFTDEQIRDRHVSPPTSRVQRFPFVRSVRDSRLWGSVQRYVPTDARKALSRASTRTIQRNAVDDSAARAWLDAYFEPRIEAFERLSGVDCSAWKAAPSATSESARLALEPRA